jgi:hypothetical protein
MHDFSFYRIQPIAVRYIGGFGKIHWVDMENYTNAQAGQFAEQEEFLLAEINSKQQHMLCRKLQSRHGIDAANAQAIGLDCDGLDVLADEQVWRLDFADEAHYPPPDALALL